MRINTIVILPKVYITKYSLTKGIIEVSNVECNPEHPDMIQVRRQYGCNLYFHKGEWFDNIEEAQTNCAVRLERKIVSSERQLEKLRKLSVCKTTQVVHLNHDGSLLP